MSKAIQVEIVLALEDEQVLLSMSLESGATIAEALAKSELQERFAGQNIDAMQTGVWGRRVNRDYRLEAGDRVELYRPLRQDPRDARRELARSGLTMREGRKGPV